MASINVNSDVSDQFYRYKMPRIIAKVEGKGNGIKTVIVNMQDVAKALSRPPMYPTKYFGCELGAQTQFDLKNDRYIVNGNHDAAKLQNLLDGFIKRFVLCPECSNPETNLVVNAKAEMIKQRCIACGHTGNVDMRHKLTTFILKNPPDVDHMTPTPTKGGKKEKKDKDKKSKKLVNGKVENGRGSPESGIEKKMDQRANMDAPPLTPEKSDEDDDWGVGLTEDDMKQRMDELSGAAKSMALSDDLDKTENQRMDIFYNFVKTKRDSGSLAGADKDILTEAERLEIKDKCTLVLVELLFDEKCLQQIKQHRVLFLRFCHGHQKAQKYLLGGFEQLVGKVHKTLMPKIPHILKELYDNDILDEEVIIEWGKKVSKRYVPKDIAQEIREKATLFIKWLETAEEDESSEEEEEEVEVLPLILTSTLYFIFYILGHIYGMVCHPSISTSLSILLNQNFLEECSENL
ncbi:hypothetical protein CHS0354_001123 [Potamilus streckersoni]|uniref:Eukaryotic translation initiation factor 5 n=1 Tax=Potamilus streckersoni TaxID=2493646 RepID=A0AAE0SYM4_9BIVA|nr:hypothetical protein CHS0354_001123 [Potamilus streckersoni]